jgi:hypothetical protein
MKAVVASRSFALADLGCALLSGAILYSRSGVIVREANGYLTLPGFTSLWPLLIALLPCLMRLAAEAISVHRTVFDLFLIIFIVTCARVWAAYDPLPLGASSLRCWGCFHLLCPGRATEENLWVAAGLISLVGALISVGFLLGYDFQNQPADLLILDRLGQA